MFCTLNDVSFICYCCFLSGVLNAPISPGLFSYLYPRFLFRSVSDTLPKERAHDIRFRRHVPFPHSFSSRLFPIIKIIIRRLVIQICRLGQIGHGLTRISMQRLVDITQSAEFERIRIRPVRHGVRHRIIQILSCYISILNIVLGGTVLYLPRSGALLQVKYWRTLLSASNIIVEVFLVIPIGSFPV